MTPSKSPWLLRPTGKPSARIRLFCVPHAGGSAAAFRAWSAAAPPFLEIIPVELPGRGARFREALVDDVARLVEELHVGLAGELRGPMAIFGHSSGALVAFEWARLLASEGRPPVQLFASGREAPAIPERAPISHLPDDELVAVIARDGGIPAEVAATPELIELLLPVIRNDARMSDHYRYEPAARLPCPVSVFVASGDAVEEGGVVAWGRETSAAFEQMKLVGDHFVVYEEESGALPPIVHALARFDRA